MKARQFIPFSIAALVLLFGSRAALAHPGPIGHDGAGFSAGALHPLLGVDHLMAMLCSGLLAVRIGTRRALILVPLVFVGLMIFGGLLAYAGIPLPQAEWGISLSVIILGLVVALAPSMPLWLGAGLVGLFAVFHGHAHVAELGTHPILAYMTGFTLTTLVLHVAAISLGMLAKFSGRPALVRWSGAALATCFVLLMVFHAGA